MCQPSIYLRAFAYSLFQMYPFLACQPPMNISPATTFAYWFLWSWLKYYFSVEISLDIPDKI